MKAPEEIYLQNADDNTDNSWCSDKINKTDTKYLRFDIHEAQIDELKTLLSLSDYSELPLEYVKRINELLIES